MRLYVISVRDHDSSFLSYERRADGAFLYIDDDLEPHYANETDVRVLRAFLAPEEAQFWQRWKTDNPAPFEPPPPPEQEPDNGDK